MIKQVMKKFYMRFYMQLEVQKGIKDMEEGNTKTSSEVKEIINK